MRVATGSQSRRSRSLATRPAGSALDAVAASWTIGSEGDGCAPTGLSAASHWIRVLCVRGRRAPGGAAQRQSPALTPGQRRRRRRLDQIRIIRQCSGPSGPVVQRTGGSCQAKCESSDDECAEPSASSSRSQRARWPTTTLTVSDLPRTVRGRPLASAGVCGGCYSFSYSPTRGRRGGGPRRELQREWEPGIASRRSCWFGRPRTAPPSCGHRVVSGPWAASSVLSCSVLPCWLGQLIRHVPWSAPLCAAAF